ncbi:hypothetical protein EON77_04080, partial [bacterium]
AVLNETPTRGNPSAQLLERTEAQLNVVIGITGEAHGHVTLGMSLATAKRIASSMIGAPIITFDALASSALGELGNMVCGNALLAISETGIVCDITPPTIIKGAKVEISTLNIPAIVVPLVLSCGEVSLAIGMQLRSASTSFGASRAA